MGKGTVRISLDFECGWGMAEGGGWAEKEASGIYRDLRPAMKRFTQRMDELEFSFCWAVVGAMVDQPQTSDLDYLKGDFARDAQRFLKEAEGPTKDGRDLLDMVLAMKTKQSYGSHTYSHLLFSDTDQDADVYAIDLQKSARVNETWGLDCSRLVFPRNIFGYLDVVAKSGFSHVRMPPENTMNFAGKRSLLRRGIDFVNRPVSRVLEREDDSGLTLHYASEFLNWGPKYAFVKKRLHARRMAEALRVAEQGGDVHFWIHPFDLSEISGLGDFVDNFLLKMKDLVDRDKILVSGF